jgi:hypothetical protein
MVYTIGSFFYQRINNAVIWVWQMTDKSKFEEFNTLYLSDNSAIALKKRRVGICRGGGATEQKTKKIYGPWGRRMS